MRSNHTCLRRGDCYFSLTAVLYAISHIPSHATFGTRRLRTEPSIDATGGAESQCTCARGSRSYGQSHLIPGVLSDIEHESHQCDAQYCPVPCQLCKRLCSSPNHLHALEAVAVHLCGYVIRCSTPQPRSEMRFVGNHMLVLSDVPLLVYAKSTQPLNRLKRHSRECTNVSSTQRYLHFSFAHIEHQSHGALV